MTDRQTRAGGAESPPPAFRSRDFLIGHIRDTLAFYTPRAFDPRGGLYHYFRDDGTVYDAETRHLVSSTRFVFDYAMAWRHFGETRHLELARHAVAFVRERHRDSSTGGYAWILRGDRVVDDTNHCYGLAFVVLAYAHALMAGIDEARAWLDEAVALMEQRFWLPDASLYADEATADWSALAPYRGQNANMHACEAMLAAYDATGEPWFLDRAHAIAQAVTVRLASRAGGLVWEHYRDDWSVDWDYNRDDPANLFRPWGFQPGHQTEWAKLLLTLEQHADRLGDATWLLPRAMSLFDMALDWAWDHRHGGFAYGFAPDGTVCDGDKYHWVQAESLAAAARLAVRTGERRYADWYDRLWDYCWHHFVDHDHGAWYRILGPDNRKLTDKKSPAGKVDYHNMGACYDVLPLAERLSRIR